MSHKRDRLFLSLAPLILVYGLVEGGREVFLYLALVYIFCTDKKNLTITQVLFTLIVFVMIVLWKVISIYVFEVNDISLMINYLSNDFRFSITNLDPLGSLLMLNEYLNDPSFFNEFKLSYLTNTINHFLRAINMIDYESIAETTSNYYIPTSAKLGGGLAFCGILESILNFGFLGPLILGIILGLISIRIMSLEFHSEFLYSVFSIFFVIICLKLVRTELAVVLKIYLMPMIVSYFLFYRATYSKKNIININV